MREDEDEDFFDAGEGAVIRDRISSCTASESGKSGGGTEDDPVGPVTPSAVLIIPHSKAPAVDFLRTISSGSTELDDDE
ncbi:hypothetical protein V8E53_008303 [Lactarius tabidus]|jgi:hypothetical protein